MCDAQRKSESLLMRIWRQPVWLAVMVWTPLVALHLATLTRVAYHYDEYKTLYNVHHSLGELMHDRLTAGHQPLYFLTAWVWSSLFGDSMLVMRLLPQLAGFGALWLLFLLIRRESDARTGVLGVALCLLTYSFIEMAQVARPYTFTLLFGLGLTYAAVTAGAVPGVKRMIAVAVLTVLLLLSHGTAYPIVLALAIYLGYTFVTRGEGGRLLLAIAAAMVVFTPWLLYTLTWVDAEARFGWARPGEWRNIPAAIFQFSFSVNLLAWEGAEHWSQRVVAWALWAGTIAAVLFGLSRLRRPGLYAVYWALPVLIAAYALFVLEANTFFVMRYFSIAIVVQAMALAAAVTWGGWPTWVRRTAWMIPVSLALVGLGREMGKEPYPYDMDVVEFIEAKGDGVELIYVLQNARQRYQLELLTGGKVRMLHQVYNIPASYNNRTVGVSAVDPDAPVPEPLPHADHDKLILVAHKAELRPKGTSVYAAPQALRDRMSELKASYDELTEYKTHRSVVYVMRGD